jgi:hypothetical protein
MRTKSYGQIGIMLTVILTCGQIALAGPISTDPAAMSSYEGSSSFSSPDGKLVGSVDFAVYSPGNYDGMYKKQFKDSYVYAYQVFNDDASKVSVDYFSVGLYSNILAQNAVYDPMKGLDAPEGSIPFMQFVLPQSVIYLFQTDNIGAGEHSLTLLFTSDTAPEMAKGAVSGGFTGGAIMDLPTPSGWIVPEPATFGLLIGGAFMAIRRSRKK